MFSLKKDIQNRTGCASCCPDRILVQPHMKHLSSLCVNVCPHLSNLQCNNANRLHDSRGDTNRQIDWLSCGMAMVGWDHFYVIGSAIAVSPNVWKQASPAPAPCWSAKPQCLEKGPEIHHICYSHSEPAGQKNWPANTNLHIEQPLIGRLTPWSPPEGYEPVIFECNGGLIS